MSNIKKPLVQVICLTYNHKPYITQALEGFVMQQTSFPFEVLIGDDASTDGTSEIIKEYTKKYPNILTHISRTENLGAMKNAQDLRNRITAKYICYCEGDDYWTDPLKLQKQVDFLEANPQYRGCFHDAEIIKDDSRYWYMDNVYIFDDTHRRYLPRSKKKFVVKSDIRLNDLIGQYIIHTATIMYRWNYDIIFPEWLNECRGGDVIIQMLQLGKDGVYFYIPEAMSCYRVANGVSSYQTHNELIEKSKIDTLLTYTKLKEYFYPSYENEFNRFLQANFVQLFNYINTTSNVELLNKFTNYFPEKYLSMVKYIIDASNSIKPPSKRKLNVYLFGLKILKIIITKNKLETYLFGFISFIKWKK